MVRLREGWGEGGVLGNGSGSKGMGINVNVYIRTHIAMKGSVTMTSV